MSKEETDRATPRPWAANQSEMEAHSSLVEIRGPGGSYSITKDVGYANAAFIVQAVNSYDRLREVNKALREVWRAAHNFIGAAAKYKAAAEAVLAEAVHEADKVNP